MSNRLKILEQSLKKKESLFTNKVQGHFDTVRESNGQPLNDKRNGQATLSKWERQNASIRTVQQGIGKTERAIEKEKGKIAGVEYAKGKLPEQILSLIESGELVQWRKHPLTFFVPGVDKARISWDDKKKVLVHKYVYEIKEQEQRTKFAQLYNALYKSLQ